MNASYRSEIRARGFCFIPKLGAGRPSAETASLLGEIENLEGFAPAQVLVPHSLAESAPNTYSGNYGLNEFPLHTDLAHWAIPPRYLFLRCVHGAKEVPTRILDGTAVVSSIGTDELRMSLVQPRRPMRNGKQLLRLLEYFDGESERALRWDRLYLKPASLFAARVYDAFSNILSSLTPMEIPLTEPGDTLVIDNWRCLHGRATVPNSLLDRKIDRVYLQYLK
jgi:hypothetical protein